MRERAGRGGEGRRGTGSGGGRLEDVLRIGGWSRVAGRGHPRFERHVLAEDAAGAPRAEPLRQTFTAAATPSDWRSRANEAAALRALDRGVWHVFRARPDASACLELQALTEALEAAEARQGEAAGELAQADARMRAAEEEAVRAEMERVQLMQRLEMLVAG